MESAIQFVADLLSKTVMTILASLGHNWLVLAFSILTAVVLKTYVNTEKLSGFLMRRSKVSIVASVLVGAFTPFCACGTMAVIVGMLTTTLPWGPIMAFLTSSPLMSPDGFVMMSGLLGLRFAIALTVASLVIGIASGFITLLIEKRTHFLKDQSRFAKESSSGACSCAGETKSVSDSGNTVPASACGCSGASPKPAGTALMDASFQAGDLSAQGTMAAGASCCTATVPKSRMDFGVIAAKWKLRQLAGNFVNLGLRQILLNFSIFIGIGYLVNYFVPSSIISVLFGNQNIFAVPLASLIGLPLYLTTESGIPIIQSLLQSGASEGAMLAFIITGSATSAWVIAGLVTFMKKRAIALYVGYILLGGILSGYLYDLLLMAAK